MFVPFYLIFWVYKSAQRIDKLAAANGVQSDISTLCLILAIFIGIVPPIIMQDKINAIAGASSSAGAAAPRAAAQAQYPQQQYAAPQPAPVQPQPASVRPQPASVQPQPAPAQPSVADQLTQYKQLLDSGAITQEEYDAVKQRLLGL
ncbi:MAG: SHOCT domain-containing protein [Oscillospiraceae bacterium]|nr:SHOCT domain-containing protein [Oscillospiraceae bacterium]